MATPVAASRASVIAAGVFVSLGLATTPCHAQSQTDASVATRAAPTVVSASDVYLACRHPSVKRLGNTSEWEKLARLCGRFRVPPPGARLTRSALANWVSVTRTDSLPSVWEIQRAAKKVQEGAEDTLRILGGRDSLTAPEIRFEPSRAELDSVQRTLIARIARNINRHLTDPKAKLIVTGVADDADGREVGTNRNLARFRAHVVANELINAGVDPAKIDTSHIVVSPRGGTEMITARQVASRGAIVDIVAPSALVRHAEYTIPARRNLLLDDPTATAEQLADPSTGGAVRTPLSLSSVAVGLTDVMLDRANEQTQMYVLDRAARELCGGTADSPTSYLRQTCGFFKDAHDLQRMRGLRSLRLAFESDIRGIPERLAFQAIQQRISSAAPDKYIDLGQSALFTLHLVEQIEQGTDPMEVFASFHRDSTLHYRGLTHAVQSRGTHTPLSSALRRYARFAARVDVARDSLGEYWSESALPTDTVLTYALRAAVVNLRHGTGVGEAERDALADLASERLPALLDAYREIDAQIAEMVQIANRLRSGDVAGDEARRELYAQFAGRMVDISAAALMPDADRRTEVRKLVVPVRTVVASARSGRYADALHGFTDLLGVLTDTTSTLSFPNAKWTNERAAFRVFALAVNVSEAESQAEVSAALNGFVGQSRDFFSKRTGESLWRVAVNGYVGAGGGLEWVAKPDTTDSKWIPGQQIAVSLPIGVELSTPCLQGWSCGVFAPLVDLGAIASARFNDPETETFPEGELGRIFTPGLYFVLGIPRMPLSLGVGGTYAPAARLREITGSDEDEVDAVRLGIFLGVDIPLFP